MSKKTTTKKSKGRVLFPQVSTHLHIEGKEGELDVEAVKRMIGWLPESATSEEFGSDFVLKDLNGEKIRLTRNVSNRPFTFSLAKQYATEMVRGKWAFTGEAWIFDRLGNAQSAQHRCVAVVLAEQMRQRNPGRYQEEYGVSGPISVPALVVYGIMEEDEVVDRIDLGKKRSHADVFYRNAEFGQIEPGRQKSLTVSLANAVKLVWKRSGGKSVSDAPHFPASEALDFLADHPRLKEAVLYIHEEDKEKEMAIRSQFFDRGQAAGFLYLMGVSATDPERYYKEGASGLDFGNWKKAEEFWHNYATGLGSGADDPLVVLRKLMAGLEQGSQAGREEAMGIVCKVWNAYVDGERLTTSKAKMKKKRNDRGRMVLAEKPRMGGIDVEPCNYQPEEDVVWQVGDIAWVLDVEGENWVGTITELKGNKATLVADIDGKEYVQPIYSLSPNELEVS